jgi:aquaporin Z
LRGARKDRGFGRLGQQQSRSRQTAAALVPYVITQTVGAIAAAGVLYLIASEKAGFDVSGGFAANGYGAHSPGGYNLSACFIDEVALTAGLILSS